MVAFPIATIALFSALSLSGCLSSGSVKEVNLSANAPPLSQIEQNALDHLNQSIAFDDQLTAGEKRALAEDWARVGSLTLSNSGNATLDQAYATLFGGATASVANFITTRSKYFASVETDMGFGRPDNGVVAANYSIFFWIQGMLDAANPASPASYRAEDGRTIANTSPRVGIVQFGDYFSSGSADSLFRIGTLVHEARHSDCPNGISATQLSAIRTDLNNGGGFDLFSHIGSCAFPHTLCPSGHELAGIAACDTGDGWGAYAIEVALFRKIYNNCQNCSEAEIQAALISLNDNASRILKLTQLTNGSLGLPNMNHQGYTN